MEWLLYNVEEFYLRFAVFVDIMKRMSKARDQNELFWKGWKHNSCLHKYEGEQNINVFYWIIKFDRHNDMLGAKKERIKKAKQTKPKIFQFSSFGNFENEWSKT